MSTLSKNHWMNFAVEHVELGEIDTPYILMAKAGEAYGDEWLERFALHYFLFYDLGGAARCAYDTGRFWKYVNDGYETCRRGTSRRHFRGEKGAMAVHNLCAHGDPGDVFAAMYQTTYAGLVHHLQSDFKGCEIGPYFAWKLMDVFDRCLGRPVRLSLPEALKFLPDTPRKGAKSFFPDLALIDSLTAVSRAIEHLPAPGAPGRNCGLPEAETILCAIYGVNKGTYHVGDDIESRHSELKDFPELIAMLPPLQDWSQYANGPLES